MAHPAKTLLFSILLISYGCTPNPAAPVMLHTTTGVIPLTDGEDPVANAKGTVINADIEGLLVLEGVSAPQTGHTGGKIDITNLAGSEKRHAAKAQSLCPRPNSKCGRKRHQIGINHRLFTKPKPPKRYTLTILSKINSA